MTQYAFILISNPQLCPLNPGDISAVSKHLPNPSPVEWLSKQEAFLIRFEAAYEDIAAINTHLRTKFEQFPFDLAITPVEGLRKKLLIADMDSTIIQQECIDEIADFADVREQVSDITERAMQGELDFEEALKERVSLLKGLQTGILQKVLDENIELTPGAHTLVQTMRANGAYCALVSGGFTFFTSRIAEQTGFNTHRANVLEIEDGTLAGTVQEPILGQQAKLEALNSLSTEYNISQQESMAVGDGANDLAMIKSAGLGVAFHAKPVVAEQADAQVNYGDLTALLFMQGYAREEFVE